MPASPRGSGKAGSILGLPIVLYTFAASLFLIYSGDAALTALDTCLGLCVHAATGLPSYAPSSTPTVCGPLTGAASRDWWDYTYTHPDRSQQVLAFLGMHHPL